MEKKFKVWNTESKKMCGTYTLTELLLLNANEAYVAGIVEALQPVKCRKLEPKIEDWNHLIFLESTGLPDKDGTEIFKDDIFETSTNRRGKVVFKNGGFVLEFYKPLEQCHLVYFIKNGKVLGNIYENPEQVMELPNRNME